MEERRQLVIIAVEHQELRHSLRRLIGDHFERMLFADDYQSLVDTISSTTPDLLLVELSLPTEEGVNVLRALNKAEISLPTIAIGDYDDEEALDEVRSAGAASYVLRTRLHLDIIPAITEALAALSERKVAPKSPLDCYGDCQVEGVGFRMLLSGEAAEGSAEEQPSKE